MRIARQPNGKYYIEHDGQRYINQTEDDYYNFVLEDARIALSIPGNIDGMDYIIKRLKSDEEAKEMGFDKPVKELISLVPLPVVNRIFYKDKYESHGQCPNCNSEVKLGCGEWPKYGNYGLYHVCPKCGQRLSW